MNLVARRPRKPFRRVAAGLALTVFAPACGSSSTDGDVAATSEQADTASAVSITACPDSPADPSCPRGSFFVTCKDGSHEVATVARIQGGKICNARTGSVSCEVAYKPECQDPITEDCTSYSVARLNKEFKGGYPTFDQVVGDKTLPYWGYVRVFGYDNPGNNLGTFEFGVTNASGASWTDRDPFDVYTNHEVDISKVGAHGLVLQNVQTKVPPFAYTDPWRTRTHAFVTLTCILTMR